MIGKSSVSPLLIGVEDTMLEPLYRDMIARNRLEDESLMFLRLKAKLLG